MPTVNSHYGVIFFVGDPGAEHPAEDLCGHAPRLSLIACGPEDFCWDALAAWTAAHPLREGEEAEVLRRDPSAWGTTFSRVPDED